MNLFLVAWPPSIKSTGRFVGGDAQLEGIAEAEMELYLVPCNAMASGNKVAEDRGMIDVHDRKISRLKMLLSYWYFKDTDMDALLAEYFQPPYPQIFADSGGFSAATQGVDIKVDEYAEWLHKWKHLFATYANLDEIGDAEKTWENQQILEKGGLQPLPVFHTKEEWRWLDHYIERYNYIALGGMVPFKGVDPIYMSWAVRCFKKAKGKAVFHGFGVTSWKALVALPWYSVDSSSWGGGFRYGRCAVFDSDLGKMRKLQLGSEEWFTYGRLVRSYGYDPADFADRERNDRAKLCGISAMSFMRLEEWLTKRHGVIEIPNCENSKGINIYLVDTGHEDITRAEKEIRERD